MFSSPYPSVSRTVCHVTGVTVSSVVRSFISAWEPWDSWTLVSVGLSTNRHCIAVRVWGGGAVNGENLMSRQRYSFYKSVEVSFLGGCKSPHIQQQLFLAAAGHFWTGFWLGLLGPAGHGRDLPLWVSERAGNPCESRWMANVSEKRRSNSPLKKKKRKKERNLKLIDEWAISHVLAVGLCLDSHRALNLIYSHIKKTKEITNLVFKIFIDENIFNLLTHWTHNII